MTNFTQGDLQLEKVPEGNTNWKLIEDGNKQKVDDGVTALNRKVGGVFTTKTEIKAIPESQRKNGTIVQLATSVPYQLYIFHSIDTTDANNDTILQPDAGNGRWRKFAPDLLSTDQLVALDVPNVDADNRFATIHDLAIASYAEKVIDKETLRSVDATQRQEYQWRFVISENTDYFFDPAETKGDDDDNYLVPDDITPPAPGRWHKRLLSPRHAAITRVTKRTGEVLAEYTVVRLDSATQNILHADITQKGQLDSVIGIVDNNYGSGEEAIVIISDLIQDPAFNFQVGPPIYFDSTGALTQTPPASLPAIKIAIAVAPDTIYVDGFQLGKVSDSSSTPPPSIPLQLFPPIGSILPWHKNLNGTPALPTEWVECNGQVLNDPDSPYHNKTLPDLNTSGMFLRGGSSSGVFQDDQMQSHKHDDSGHSHQYDTRGTQFGLPGPHGGGNLWDLVTSRTSSTDSANLTDPTESTADTPRHGDETRPKNMSIIWIMRVK